MRKRRMERALLIGLVLSTSIYGTSFAADGNTINIDAVELSKDPESKSEDGFIVTKNEESNNRYAIEIGKDTVITGVYGSDHPSVDQENTNSLVAYDIHVAEGKALMINGVVMNSPYITGKGDIVINTTDKEHSNNQYSTAGIYVNGKIEANSLTINNNIEEINFGKGIHAYSENTYPHSQANPEIKNSGMVYVDVVNYVNINSYSDGIFTNNVDKSGVELKAGSLAINNTTRNGIYNSGNVIDGTTAPTDKSNNIIINTTGDIDIQSGIGDDATEDIDEAGVKSKNAGQTTLTSEIGSITVNSQKSSGVYAEAGTVQLTAEAGNNTITANLHGVDSKNADIDLKAKNNFIQAGDITQDAEDNFYGSEVAVNAETRGVDTKQGTVDVIASKAEQNQNGINQIYGAVTSVDNGAVNIDGRINYIGSSYQVTTEVNPSDPDKTDSIVSAVYTDDGGMVNINGTQNTVRTSVADNQKERVIWAQSGTVNINGLTNIIAQNGATNEANQVGVALAAGASYADGTEETRAAAPGVINAELESGSYIQGDILAGIDGIVNLNTAKAVPNLRVNGNILAANGGVTNVNLGDNSTWTGRADSYMDAANNSEEHTTFFAPQFSREITSAGDVDITLGENSTWNVNGQSWVTTLNTTPTTTIDLVAANNDRNTDAQALTIENLNGSGTFKMDLDGTRSQSDMLYVKNGSGTYDVLVNDVVTTDDMYADNHTGLRFATVGKGANVKFANVMTKDAGAFDIKYRVETDEYATSTENAAYDGTSMTEAKPGASSVEDLFTETPTEETQSQVLKAKVAEANVSTQAETNGAQATNHKIVAIEEYIPNEDGRPNDGNSGTKLSDAGRTILNMAKANYNQAVHMDTLNKRMGEARYLEEDQEGLWVRMRHDKTDKDTGFEISTNMYELGYDKKYESKDNSGYHRRGVALDYMDGDTSYDDIAGGGETNRKGIWVYDTWFGNKGHYTDYIAKWGHLENSFDLYTKSRGEKVSGEYNNDVYSISAEWGYKDKLNDNGWYLEPQLQMQYARVTGADYTTTQGTDVSVDGFDSLIARAGFRLGKDFGQDKKSTFYIKGDVLHEFLGDQDITVMDKTTDGIARSIGYDNDGTWYTIGLGFSTMLSDHSYAFLDVEKLFGNDNDNSYQINGGVQWAL
ncbi:autotransporter outer membrane beta-barrel domain-containing protein [Megamonas hypermegale]|uniref:autotransporter outer membrane beta-barrel domain-containing protein n=1 Tax=Megamonas hypermegale TaxID=158847 RepID=UPI0026F355B7|nr:autotransporter outer membrane beta-barrel domain-containing protein [Megamonas hypermegale]